MDTQIEKKRGTYEQQVQSPPSNLYSPSSSPSHEFSFTISFNPSSNNIKSNNTSTPLAAAADKSIPPPQPLSSSAMDLSPADDIFFHGHLLPLHHLPHLPTSSPRNSLDSFTLPIQDLPQDHTSNSNGNDVLDDVGGGGGGGDEEEEEVRIQIRPKAKSFSLFGKSRWRKESEINGEKERQKKKPRFDVSHMLKKYMRMVRPLLSMKSNSKREINGELIHKQSHSYSGNVSLRHDHNGLETRRREFSAPASMWTSPSNSGILVPKGKINLQSHSSSSASSDSTMEELQAAIQAAITHCKNSIATDVKN